MCVGNLEPRFSSATHLMSTGPRLEVEPINSGGSFAKPRRSSPPSNCAGSELEFASLFKCIVSFTSALRTYASIPSCAAGCTLRLGPRRSTSKYTAAGCSFIPILPMVREMREI